MQTVWQSLFPVTTALCLQVVGLLILPTLSTQIRTNEKCGIYLAPSTIPGAGMGMFAGHRSFGEDDLVTDGDLVIPVYDLEWHNGNRPIHFLWEEYSWSTFNFDNMDDDIDNPDEVYLCSGGMGAALNCRINLVNVEDAGTSLAMSTSGVTSESPGAGAFTPYHGRNFKALTHIPPGMELYADYGKDYFKSRSGYDAVPFQRDYKRADGLLKRFRSLGKKVPALSGRENVSGTLSDALYNLIVHDFPVKSRTIYALPSNVSQIDHVLATGGTANSTYNESIRDLAWLEEHGQCMDNIKDGVSRIPHAGRGAFANRFIPEGGLVAPLPLIHIGDRNILTMYEPMLDKTGKRLRNVKSPSHKQLLLNYCFGHKDTSLLLCPYGMLTALINHSHQQPNARIVWSKNLRHPEWLNESYHKWHSTNHAGLSFDLVALRDIEEDEEILIDYGEEWEKAWQEHVARFDSPRRRYMPAFEMNQQVDLQIKTIYETDYEGIGGIDTYCRKTIVEMMLDGFEGAMVEDEEREEDTIDGDAIEDEDSKLEVYDCEGEECYRCRVVHRTNNDSYVADLFIQTERPHGSSGKWDIQGDKPEFVLFDVPRDTFYFRDVFYTRDHHQYWAFRHDMRIPDDMMPSVWRGSLALLSDMGKMLGLHHPSTRTAKKNKAEKSFGVHEVQVTNIS